MKKLVVNKDACIGCGACVAIDGEHFDFGDDNLSEVISQENIETDAVKNAMSSCPTGAISYSENDDDNDSCPNCKEKKCCQKDECHCGDEADD